jgi:hypothetical protein
MVEVGDVVSYIENNQLKFGKVKKILKGFVIKEGKTINAVWLEGEVGYKEEQDLLTEEQISKMFEVFREYYNKKGR